MSVILPEHLSYLKTETVTPDNLRVGDTVFWNGDLRTVGKNSIKRCKFMGMLFDGARTNTIDRVLFPNWNGSEIINYVAQK